MSGANPFGDSKFADRNWHILDALRDVAAEHGRSPAQVALAWVLARPGVTTTLIGASTVAQLDENLMALDLALTDQQMRRLDDVSAIVPGFTDGLALAGVRRMVFGGHAVRGWRE